MLKGKTVLKELTPYQQGTQIDEVKNKYGLDDIVKLASNENPFGYSDEVKKMFSAFSDDLHIYPDGHAAKLRAALAAKLNVDEDQFIFGGGSDEIIQVIGSAFLYPGMNTVMAAPTFPQYKHSAMVEGAAIKEIPAINGYHDLEGMLQAIDKHTSVVWLCSPNNPTGALIPKEAFYQFMDNCPADVVVVLDEAYYEYIDPEMDNNAIRYLDRYPNLILLRTFSKAYGLAGLRIGYGIADKELIAKLNVVRGPFNTSSIAQKAALAALDDEQFIHDTVKENWETKLELQHFLTEIGWHFYDSQTNFLLISTPINGEEAFQFLLEQGFIVRPAKVLEDANVIRVTIGKREDMSCLMKHLKKLHDQASKVM